MRSRRHRNSPWHRMPPTYLWLFAVGRHKTIITSRTIENKKCQKASSSHNSDQSCGKCKEIIPWKYSRCCWEVLVVIVFCLNLLYRDENAQIHGQCETVIIIINYLPKISPVLFSDTCISASDKFRTLVFPLWTNFGQKFRTKISDTLLKDS